MELGSPSSPPPPIPPAQTPTTTPTTYQKEFVPWFGPRFRTSGSGVFEDVGGCRFKLSTNATYLRVDPLGCMHRIEPVDSEAGVHKLPVKGALGVDKSDFGRGELGRRGGWIKGVRKDVGAGEAADEERRPEAWAASRTEPFLWPMSVRPNMRLCGTDHGAFTFVELLV